MRYGDDRPRLGPLGVIAGLVATGVVGGNRRQRVLARLKAIAVWIAVASVLVAIVLGFAALFAGTI